MTKRQEIDDPNSCLNRGPDDELKFVIREVDVTAPGLVRVWCRRRIAKGRNLHSDPQIQEALSWADAVERKLGIAPDDQVDDPSLDRALKAEAALTAWKDCGDELLAALTETWKLSTPIDALTVFLAAFASGIHDAWLNKAPENGFTMSAPWPKIGRLEISIRRVDGKTPAEVIGDLRARIAELEGASA